MSGGVCGVGRASPSPSHRQPRKKHSETAGRGYLFAGSHACAGACVRACIWATIVRCVCLWSAHWLHRTVLPPCLHPITRCAALSQSPHAVDVSKVVVVAPHPLVVIHSIHRIDPRGVSSCWGGFRDMVPAQSSNCDQGAPPSCVKWHKHPRWAAPSVTISWHARS